MDTMDGEHTFQKVVEEFSDVMDILAMRQDLTVLEIATMLTPVVDMARDALRLYAEPSAPMALTDDEIWEFWCNRPAVPEGGDDSTEAEFVSACRRAIKAATKRQALAMDYEPVPDPDYWPGTKPVQDIGAEQDEPVPHCEAGPAYCQQCLKESPLTYGSEEIRKLREVIKSQANIIDLYESEYGKTSSNFLHGRKPEFPYGVSDSLVQVTTYAAQRQSARSAWVGLTDEEIEKVWQRVQANDFHDCVQPLARAIEQLSKEKNT